MKIKKPQQFTPRTARQWENFIIWGDFKGYQPAKHLKVKSLSVENKIKICTK